MLVDKLWYRDKTALSPAAERIAKAVKNYLLEEREGLNAREPEVEKAVRAIPENDPPEVQSLASVAWRHITAQNCHTFERERRADRLLTDEEVQHHTGRGPDGECHVTEITEDEHPVNRWLRSLPDSVVSALIRENPLWLRSAAVADRICRWRLEFLNQGKRKADALGYLRQLASPHASTRKGRPAIGPRSPDAEIQRAVATVEAQHGDARKIWHSVRVQAGDKATLLDVGERFIRRLGGWDSQAVVEWAKQRADSPFLLRLTEDQVVKHLGRHAVIVTEARGAGESPRCIVIDDEGWPRASTVAVLAARWKVSVGWIRKRLRASGK